MSLVARSTPLALMIAAVLQLNPAPAWPAKASAFPELQQEYWTRSEKRDWDAVINAAQLKVDEVRASNAPPAKLAWTLSVLGQAQLGKEDFTAAAATFTEALQLLEPIARGVDARLVEPLRGMGFALAGQNDYVQAVGYMEKSLAILRRTDGLFDISQKDTLTELASSLSVMGKAEEASQQMQYLRRVGEQAYGPKDLRLVPHLCAMGDWYAQHGQITDAREQYRDALEIVENKAGEHDLTAVLPLRGLGHSYIVEVSFSNYGIRTQPSSVFSPPDGQAASPINPRYLSSDGERALLQALSILDAHANRPADVLVSTLLQVGDWYQVKHQPDKALPYYQRAASLALSATQGSKAEEAVLGFPLQLYYPTPALATRYLNWPPSEVRERFVQVEFTVNSDGSVENQRVIDKDASRRQVSQTLEAISNARYRPKFVDGRPVETVAVSYRQIFRQRRKGDKDEEES